jgi:thioester reductase-like protein
MRRSPVSAAAVIVQYGITRMMLTPTLLDACLACDDGIDALRRLKLIVLCGEVVYRPVLERAWELLPDTRISNLYSISECHDVAACDLLPGSPVCTGYVADFAEVHITDPADSGRLFPAGETGRVLVGGAALANGYLDPELTERRFIHVSLEGGERQRVYDTGDLGLLDEQGRLTILGRLDESLKIRGSWVEPDLIMEILLAHPDVRRASVIADGSMQGKAQLSAFVVTGETESPGIISSLRDWLSERVVPQALPSLIKVVDQLPLMPSGKVDRRQLAEMRRSDMTGSSAGDQPNLESLVLQTFRDVLERPEARSGDNFEMLGGDSLTAIMLCGELHYRTGKRVRVSDLLRCQNASVLAHHLLRATSDHDETWELPSLGDDLGLAEVRTSPSTPCHVLVTGATGTLGSALVARLLTDTECEISVLVRGPGIDEVRRRLEKKLSNTEVSRLDIVVGDLSAPRLGLSQSVLNGLAEKVDRVIHAGADLDMFASYHVLEATNVGGTRELLRLALAADARFCHVSSSAVLPLGDGSAWDETSYGMEVAETLASGLGFSDGYSRTKLAAEALVWQARAQGLGGSVVRIPHLIGSGVDSRLANTVQLLAEMRLLPEGEWGWQVASVDAVCKYLISWISSGAPSPLKHLMARAITNSDLMNVLAERGIHPMLVPMPALVSRLLHHQTDNLQMASIRASLNQLIAEFGPWAALSLADGKLEAEALLVDNPVRLLEQLILKPEN